MARYCYTVSIEIFDIKAESRVRTYTRSYFHTAQRLMVGEDILIGEENPRRLKVANIAHREVTRKIWPLSLWCKEETHVSLTLEINNTDKLRLIDFWMLATGFRVVDD